MQIDEQAKYNNDTHQRLLMLGVWSIGQAVQYAPEGSAGPEQEIFHCLDQFLTGRSQERDREFLVFAR